MGLINSLLNFYLYLKLGLMLLISQNKILLSKVNPASLKCICIFRIVSKNKNDGINMIIFLQYKVYNII